MRFLTVYSCFREDVELMVKIQVNPREIIETIELEACVFHCHGGRPAEVNVQKNEEYQIKRLLEELSKK